MPGMKATGNEAMILFIVHNDCNVTIFPERSTLGPVCTQDAAQRRPSRPSDRVRLECGKSSSVRTRQESGVGGAGHSLVLCANHVTDLISLY